MHSKQKDVELLIKLYELRRDDAMRRARAWYFSEFNPQSAKDIGVLLLSGLEASAHYRMVTSYWEMAASFVANGGIDEKMFLDANSEHLGIWSKLEPFIAEMREMFREPDYLVHLEALVMKTPNAKEILERRRAFFQRWLKPQAQSA